MKKLICECSSTKFYKSQVLLDNVVLTVNPPIQVEVYVCEKCGKRHTLHTQHQPFAQTSSTVFFGNDTHVVEKGNKPL
jgi:hypothetical protein